MADGVEPERSPFKDEKMNFSISHSLLRSHTPSSLNAGVKRSGATCHKAMAQCCYLAKGAKRPSHATNMLSIFRQSETFCLFLVKWHPTTLNRNILIRDSEEMDKTPVKHQDIFP